MTVLRGMKFEKIFSIVSLNKKIISLMFKFLKYFYQEIVQLLIGLDQHLHVDNGISHVHKEAEYYLLNKDAIKKRQKLGTRI